MFLFTSFICFGMVNISKETIANSMQAIEAMAITPKATAFSPSVGVIR